MPPQSDEQLLSTTIPIAENVMLVITQLGHDHSEKWVEWLKTVTQESAHVVVGLRNMHQVLLEERRQQSQQGNTP
jgi:hypothetical protein